MFRKTSPISGRFVATIAAAFLLTACGGLSVEQDYPENNSGSFDDGGSLFGLFKKSGTAEDASETQTTIATQVKALPAGLGVNAVLWQASLDTLSFLPLASADPMGGVIITDWYNDPGAPGERIKVNVVISGLELRADALRVSIFREMRSGNRTVSLAASSRAERQMENIILTKARDLATAAR